MNILKQEFIVEAGSTANSVGSGTLAVLGTPVMIAWMENTAMKLADNITKEGETSVGTMLNAEHLKASGVGEKISCKASLTAHEGRKLCYEIECTNEKGEIIGKAKHERFVVNVEKFMSKL